MLVCDEARLESIMRNLLLDARDARCESGNSTERRIDVSLLPEATGSGCREVG